MRNTMTFILFLATWLGIWLLFGLLGWIATPGMSYRAVLGTGGCIGVTIMLGWLPGIFIAMDRHN